MALFEKNLVLSPPIKLTSFRKVALGTWRSVGDPSVYGTIQLNVEPVLNYIHRLQQKSRARITITHFIGKAVAHTIEKHPEINCVLRWGSMHPRSSVDVFFQIASDTKGNDLSGYTVRSANGKTMIQLSEELSQAANRVRTQNDPDFKRMKSVVKLLPGFLSPLLVKITGFLMYSLNLWSPLFGMPKDPFGSVMITNIGSLGLDQAYAPLVPYSRVPLLICVGAIKNAPWIEGDHLVIRKIVTLSVTVDHRYMDGVHGSLMFKTIKKAFENPEAIFGEI